MLFFSDFQVLSRVLLGAFLFTQIPLNYALALAVSEPILSASNIKTLAQANPSRLATPDCTSKCTVGGLYVLSETDISSIFPLKKTDVSAKISGNISRVEVTQIFENSFDEALEAIYVFPLPDEAAVDHLEIKIGDRMIKSTLKKREEAKAIYEQAKAAGNTTALLEQERDNIFTQSLANIKPGEKIEVKIRYTESLKFQGGNYEFVFPMVVGPRYIPGTPNNGLRRDTERVPDASRITPPVLPPATRSGHDINVKLEIDAGILGQQITSPSHQILTQNRGDKIEVTLAKSDTIPNKDLIIRYQVSGENTKITTLTQADSRGGHFATYLIPALEYNQNEIVAKDVIFLMDTSGSQRGEPLAKSKQLMRRFIQSLNPNDTFTIIDFSDTTTALSATPLANTVANQQKAMAYIDQLEANGGTELLNGIQTVMNFPSPPTERLRSIVLITDGYIGNENEVIAEVKNQLKSGNRLYSFGVGSSVNRFLLNRLAEIGRGSSQITRPDEPTEDVVESFLSQINNPVLTNIQVSWDGVGEPVEVYPVRLPDLFDSQPLVIFGRKTDHRSGKLKIRGITASGDRYEQIIPINFAPPNNVKGSGSNSSARSEQDFGNIAIAQLWGRAKIKHLMNQMFGGETKSGVEAVTQTALDYRLLSQYTAFVAVSEEVRVDPDGTRRTVQIPVELPEGVSYEGIFGSQPQPNGMSNAVPSYAPTPLQQPRPSSGGVRSVEIAPPTPTFSRQPSNVPIRSGSRLKVLAVEGLTQDIITELNRYLQGVNLPEGVRGEVIFEVVVSQGNVERIIWDDINSTFSPRDRTNEVIVLDRIRRSLQLWQPPADINDTIRITLQLQPD
ncbi:VIT domain-containing protein [Limnoraphis robusta]|uniref:VIT domain-containing protein n=1 Tax=Limnoraphis robusta CCNP1315 TaxID=3110306 RepID=A0ABU5U4N8_9CYAN|nr:VIT domain-containing protein [Limnoraphis robusta]MEA5521083.1 VIT domain-containing protein [Limnoraphis robusta CCNP1315]MEA5543472.1 VIT domain-containing protein [Limnoraphis robusta CCNP1324]